MDQCKQRKIMHSLKKKSYTKNNLWKITLEAIMKNTTGMNAGPFYDKNKLSY